MCRVQAYALVKLGSCACSTRAEQTDKLIAVLANDPLWASAKDIPDVPDRLVEGTRSHVRPHKLGVG